MQASGGMLQGSTALAVLCRAEAPVSMLECRDFVPGHVRCYAREPHA